MPRYDSVGVDPQAIKSKLNQYGNSVYTSLWMQGGCPKDIIIQDQKLDCNGELRNKRFGYPNQPGFDNKPWDGIHLRGILGSQHFTNSMARIFAASFPEMQMSWSNNQSGDSNYHNMCAQTVYQRRHFGKRRPFQQNTGQRNYDNYGPHSGFNRRHSFSHQPSANKSRGFKKNNSSKQKSYEDQDINQDNVYNIPVSNRFQGNF